MDWEDKIKIQTIRMDSESEPRFEFIETYYRNGLDCPENRRITMKLNNRFVLNINLSAVIDETIKMRIITESVQAMVGNELKYINPDGTSYNIFRNTGEPAFCFRVPISLEMLRRILSHIRMMDYRFPDNVFILQGCNQMDRGQIDDFMNVPRYRTHLVPDGLSLIIWGEFISAYEQNDLGDGWISIKYSDVYQKPTRSMLDNGFVLYPTVIIEGVDYSDTLYIQEYATRVLAIHRNMHHGCDSFIHLANHQP